MGEVKKFRIVGPDEIYGDAKDYISIDSPMARALLKKEIDDEVMVRTPEGEKEWLVNKIDYKADGVTLVRIPPHSCAAVEE